MVGVISTFDWRETVRKVLGRVTRRQPTLSQARFCSRAAGGILSLRHNFHRPPPYCREAQVDWEWLPGDRLRTRQVRPALARHPESIELLWFNQARLFHVSNLQVEVCASMREVFNERNLPRSAYFGNGSPIPDSDIDPVREAYRTSEVAFPWRQGDALLLDNMLITHGRNPYHALRRILAVLSQPFHARRTGL
jgi:hypothetical protein